MERRIVTLKVFFNYSFNNILNQKINDIEEFSNPNFVLDLLKDIDKKYFENIPYSVGDSQKVFYNNFNKIIREIYGFYEKKGIYLEHDLININSLISKSRESLKLLAELIIGIAVQSDRKAHFLEIMEEKMEENHGDELLHILNERITNYTESEIKLVQGENNPGNEEDNNLLNKLETLENENFDLNEKVNTLSAKVNEQSLTISTLETNLSQLHALYDEINFQQSSKAENSYKFQEENLELSMIISDLKGKISANEKALELAIFEKNQKISENIQQMNEFKQQINSLKEIEVKYYVLKEKFDVLTLKSEEMNQLKKQKILHENMIKDQEEKIKRLTQFVEKDKASIFKAIEEKNYRLELEKTKVDNLEQELELYKSKFELSQEEKELLMSKLSTLNLKEEIKQIEKINLFEKDEGKSEKRNSETEKENEQEITTLRELEEQYNVKKHQMEMEDKIDNLMKERELFSSKINSLNDKIKELEGELNEANKEIKNLLKYKEKLNISKDENKEFQRKIEDLYKSLNEMNNVKLENSELKLQNLKNLNELEKKYEAIISNNSFKFNEEITVLMEKITSLEKEVELSKRENKKLIEIAENAKNFENAEKKKIIENTQNELNFNRFLSEEIENLKNTLTEKNNEIISLNDNIRSIQSKLDILDSEKAVLNEKINKKDLLILENTKILSEMKESFSEEQRMMSKIFYELSVSLVANKFQKSNQELLKWEISKK